MRSTWAGSNVGEHRRRDPAGPQIDTLTPLGLGYSAAISTGLARLARRALCALRMSAAGDRSCEDHVGTGAGRLCEQPRRAQTAGQPLRGRPAHRVTLDEKLFSPLLGPRRVCGVLQVLADLQGRLRRAQASRGTRRGPGRVECNRCSGTRLSQAGCGC